MQPRPREKSSGRTRRRSNRAWPAPRRRASPSSHAKRCRSHDAAGCWLPARRRGMTTTTMVVACKRCLRTRTPTTSYVLAIYGPPQRYPSCASDADPTRDGKRAPQQAQALQVSRPLGGSPQPVTQLRLHHPCSSGSSSPESARIQLFTQRTVLPAHQSYTSHVDS